MAETNMSLFRQIQKLNPSVPLNSCIILRYARADRKNRFPDGLTYDGFLLGLRLFYRDDSLQAYMVHQSEALPESAGSKAIFFTYVATPQGPVVKRGR